MFHGVAQTHSRPDTQSDARAAFAGQFAILKRSLMAAIVLISVFTYMRLVAQERLGPAVASDASTWVHRDGGVRNEDNNKDPGSRSRS